MKFLTFTDVHEDQAVLKELVKRASQDDIDFMICCGDISTFGRGLKSNLAKLHSVGKKIYIIPGNHEEGAGVLDGAIKGLQNCVNFDRQVVEIGGYLFLGYGGGGFTLKDPEFRKISRDWYGKYKGKKIVLVTHQPPYGTKLDRLGQRHVGNEDYRKFIERIEPKVAISGHLHETVGLSDSIGKTKVVNPGWDGMVVELK